MKRVAIFTFIMSGFLISASAEIDVLKTGKQLARPCTWCHDTKRELIAPSFKEIADRYRDIPDARKILFNSIKEGSKGRWKKWFEKGMYMPPQKPYYSDKQIDMIVEWILSLK
ncbi:MAG TPA: hypothetical protein DEP48_00340 [Persephonella sp.]|uniref:Cytochrome c family protein n=1 Tax=Persephonella marina (strain DSM 14350 / EX-H1) TaxID=123214 RepID=C0QQU0_PERMH|nr:MULTISPECIES: c-type cytochrome [Persephonella]ACO03952.1 cytochrome c family protein [Persephonella marina EX-H1]HCB68786.1 hypothetical protein [Persephonella sp.]